MIIWIDELYRSSITGKVESTLSLKFEDLMAWVAERAGYGYRANEAAGLTTQDETEIGLYVEEGYREFLMSYEWSFLRPTTTSVLWATTDGTATLSASGEGNKTITASAATFYPTMVGHTIVSTNGSYVIDGYLSTTIVTVTTDASADEGLAFTITADGSYRMPDDFGGLLGEVFFQAGDGRWVPLANTGVAELLELHQVSTSTGRPTMCAVDCQTVATASPDGVGQRHNLLAWRIADSDYTVAYQYQVLVPKLIADGYPYGGARHAETIKYACLAALERSKFQLADGPSQRQWRHLLGLSIKADQRGTRAGTLGLLTNSNSRRGSRYPGFCYPLARTVTCGGVAYP
jgi:hypothetical protein